METVEVFTEQQQKILERFVTNADKNVFVLRNLPEVIKGALFSRYSRSSLGLRSLLLKEFIQNDETAFAEIAGVNGMNGSEEQLVAIRRAQNFYDRILDGYGDDSIGELGGAHLAFEQISMLAAKVIEDSRIGGSPLEKSSRYIFFDQMVNGEYLFYREPVLMASAYKELYVNTCNMLFETYSRLAPELTEIFAERMPRDNDTSKAAYTAALRAKVLDCLRGLLPAGTLTNVGVFGNGRFFEGLLQRLQMSPMAETQDLGRQGFEELSKVIPSFIRRAEVGHRHYDALAQFMDTMRSDLQAVTSALAATVEPLKSEGVRLVKYMADAPQRVAAALLFPYSQASMSELQKFTAGLADDAIGRILDAASAARENRRHKSPRALEVAQYTFEIVADYGCYRDLHRHRLLTQERQRLGCTLGYHLPPDIVGLPAAAEYQRAMERAHAAWELIAADFPDEAQYIVPMAYNIHWMMHVDLRSLQWICELRSQPQGHPSYRRIAQNLYHIVCHLHPSFERFFRYVDTCGYNFGRYQQELKRALEKASEL